MLLDLETMGVTLSLDDFGTGYSSLLRLQSLPVSEIKIDRAFVSKLSESESTVGIVRAIVDLAHALGMPAIAEGVETEAEWQILRELGCDGAQGWHIAVPMSPDQTTDWLLAIHGMAGPVVLAGRLKSAPPLGTGPAGRAIDPPPTGRGLSTAPPEPVTEPVEVFDPDAAQVS
jgi:predicted signal transduction protein with EAL and GGDEF domain